MIGGGIIGLEMACVYDALGSKVTVVEMLDQLMTGADPDLVRPLAKRIGGRYEEVLLGTRVGAVKAQKNGLKVEIGDLGAPDVRSGAGRGRPRAERSRDRRRGGRA